MKFSYVLLADEFFLGMNSTVLFRQKVNERFYFVVFIGNF